MNEYFELLEDKDFTDSNADSWIWICDHCHALFRSKSIPNRTIFPWFGYHPLDGNCKIIDAETSELIVIKANQCDCDGMYFRRATCVGDVVKGINTARHEYK